MTGKGKGRLVQRSRLNQDATVSPAPRSAQRVPQQQSSELPPYEPPSCALTISQRRAIEQLKHSHDYDKYKKHIKNSILVVTAAATECNDRLSERRQLAQKVGEKRKRDGTEDQEKSQEDIEDEVFLKQFVKKVQSITEEAEISLRKLIDYDDEVAMIPRHLENVIAELPAPPVVRPRVPKGQRPGHRQRGSDDEGGNEQPAEAEEEESEQEPVPDVPFAAPSKLYSNIQNEYHADYQSKSMRERYDNNDYKNFKRVVHDAQHPEENAPPVPHAKTWFPEDRQGDNGEANNRDDDYDSDEPVIAAATANLKCIFSLAYFKEPWKSNSCGHTFEKEHIIAYINDVPRGHPKENKCPQTGCPSMLKLGEFHLDKVVQRQVKRAQEAEARGDDEDESEGDDNAPRGTQINRPQKLPSSDNEEEDDDDRDARIKRERAKSRGPRGVLARNRNDDDDIEMED